MLLECAQKFIKSNIVHVTVCAGNVLAMSNKHLHDAVCSLLCRADLLLAWSAQINNSGPAAAEKLHAGLSSLLKVFSYYSFSYSLHPLTLSITLLSNGYTLKRSGPYWSNPPFLIFDIRALWRLGLSARVPECQKNLKGWVRPVWP